MSSSFYLVGVYFLHGLIIMFQKIPPYGDIDTAIAKGAAIYDAMQHQILRFGETGRVYSKQSISVAQV
jgi:hypothetical protein